jgi:PTS system, lactose/cellobiose family IIC component
MNALINWMEHRFVPIAAKIGSQRHLVAIRDAFISIMPITMAGAVASLINVFVRDLPGMFGMTDFVNLMSPVISVNGNVWWGTTVILSLVFIVALGYNLANSYDVNPLAGGLIAISSYLVTTSQMTLDGSLWGYFHWGAFGASALFTCLFVGLVSTSIYVWLTKKGFIIKMPDAVPPAVAKAFAAIVPGTITIYVFAIIAFIFNTYVGQSLNDWVFTTIQTPFMIFTQGLPSVIIVTLTVQLLWFFGLHGTNVLGPLLEGAWLTALTENNSAYMGGASISNLPYLWTRGSFDAYAWMGGAGCTLALVIALLVFSKREDEKAVAKVSAPMGIFNINEPVTFGLPIVLNPIYLIPWVLITPILVTIAYLFTAVGIIPPVFIQVPWIVPPVFYAFLATGGNFLAAGVALLNFVIAVILWSIFVKVANRMVDSKSSNESMK